MEGEMRGPHNTISIYVHISHKKKVNKEKVGDLCRSMLKIGPMQQYMLKSSKEWTQSICFFSRIQIKNIEKL